MRLRFCHLFLFLFLFPFVSQFLSLFLFHLVLLFFLFILFSHLNLLSLFHNWNLLIPFEHYLFSIFFYFLSLKLLTLNLLYLLLVILYLLSPWRDTLLLTSLILRIQCIIHFLNNRLYNYVLSLSPRLYHEPLCSHQLLNTHLSLLTFRFRDYHSPHLLGELKPNIRNLEIDVLIQTLDIRQWRHYLRCWLLRHEVQMPFPIILFLEFHPSNIIIDTYWPIQEPIESVRFKYDIHPPYQYLPCVEYAATLSFCFSIIISCSFWSLWIFIFYSAINSIDKSLAWSTISSYICLSSWLAVGLSMIPFSMMAQESMFQASSNSLQILTLHFMMG